MPIQNARSDERKQYGVFAKIEIGKRFVHFMRDWAEHHALVEPEKIRGAEHNAERRPGSPGFTDIEDALQNGEFADEAVEQRHAEGAEADDQINCREIRHGRGQAAEFGDQARVAALVEHADDEEQRAGGDAVIDLLEDAAGEALRRERKDAERAEAQMADGRVGDEALHVLLHQADDGAVDDADRARAR